MVERTRRAFLAASGTALTGLVAGCSGSESGGPAESGGEAATGSWRQVQLRNALGDGSDGSFTISGLLADGPVVLETFAVWCSVCTRQQEQMQGLDGAELTRLSVNTDPNEDESAVRSHAREDGFDWLYAVAPAEMTMALVEEFGASITNPPSAPVVVVCPDGSSTYLDERGVKSAETIRSTARNC